jgi:ubiquinone/menaquinone biosynthesis C-methylase UbiE
MPNLRAIYFHHANRYEEMIACEDYRDTLIRAVGEICPLEGRDVVEFGAGTGRVTRQIAPLARSIHAFDYSHPMLTVAQEKLNMLDRSNWSISMGENRQMPVASGCADLAIEGWSFGHLPSWYPNNWQGQASLALGEMERVLRPGGTMILIETLGTGYEEPKRYESLSAFYRWLEEEKGFRSNWIRTDYRFKSVDQAVDLIGFFFGDELANEVAVKQLKVVPECTGLWWRTV